MPRLTFQQMFGSMSNTERIDAVGDDYTIELNVKDYQNIEDEGDIENNLGISNLYDDTFDWYAGNRGLQLFYLIMLLIMQNQATEKDDDIEQKIYITSSTPRIITFGNRKGQLERRFTVSIFSDGNFDEATSVDNI